MAFFFFILFAPSLSLQTIVYAHFVTHPFHFKDLKKKQKYIFASQIAFLRAFITRNRR